MAVLLECAACYQRYAVPGEATARTRPCPWCGAFSAPIRIPASLPAGGFPELSPSRFPRRRRSLPSLVWLGVGLGLGACVALFAVVVWLPAGSKDIRANDGNHSAIGLRQPADVAPGSGRRLPGLGSAATKVGDSERTKGIAATAAGDRVTTEALLRRLVRDELNRKAVNPANVRREAAARPHASANVGTARWLSDRPPPIGDPEDDAPRLGLTLSERVPERLGAPPSTLDDTKNEPAASTMPRPARVADDATAIAALAAAGIRGEPDAETGLITRLDGSFKMTDKLMPHVSKLRGLVRLQLSFSEVTDAGLAHVAELSGLTELILNQTKVTDAGLVHLAKLVHLEKLDLEKTGVTDESLERLKGLKRLMHLDVRGTKVTRVGANNLKKAFPSAKVRY